MLSTLKVGLLKDACISLNTKKENKKKSKLTGIECFLTDFAMEFVKFKPCCYHMEKALKSTIIDVSPYHNVNR